MINKTISLSSPERARRFQTGGVSPRYKMITCAILVIIAMMAAGCGKFHSCECAYYTPFDIVDTALADSVHGYPVNINVSHRESAMECSYWSSRDTVGQYLPEYGIQMYYVIDCYEEGEVPRMEFSENGK